MIIIRGRPPCTSFAGEGGRRFLYIIMGSHYLWYISGNYKQIYVFTCNIPIFFAIMFYVLDRGDSVCAKVNNVLLHRLILMFLENEMQLHVNVKVNLFRRGMDYGHDKMIKGCETYQKSCSISSLPIPESFHFLRSIPISFGHH